MNIKLLFVGLLAILFLCCLLALWVVSLVPQPAAAPDAWQYDTQRLAQATSTNRLMGFLVTLVFGDGLTFCCALPLILGGLVFLGVRALQPET